MTITKEVVTICKKDKDDLSKFETQIHPGSLVAGGMRGSAALGAGAGLPHLWQPAGGGDRVCCAIERGATALVFGVSALVIIGCVGLGTEVGMWYLVRREAQGAADASAVAGALAATETLASCTGTNPGNAATTAATSLAAANGFSDGATTTLGTVSVTPSYLSPYTSPTGVTGSVYPCPTGNVIPGAAAVLVSEAVTPLISGLFGGTGVTVGARSVALVEPLGPACALALDSAICYWSVARSAPSVAGLRQTPLIAPRSMSSLERR